MNLWQHLCWVYDNKITQENWNQKSGWTICFSKTVIYTLWRFKTTPRNWNATQGPKKSYVFTLDNVTKINMATQLLSIFFFFFFFGNYFLVRNGLLIKQLKMLEKILKYEKEIDARADQEQKTFGPEVLTLLCSWWEQDFNFIFCIFFVIERNSRFNGSSVLCRHLCWTRRFFWVHVVEKKMAL